ncbi:type VI secretion system baseplate subunit TssK [Aquisalimonas lutea]|uniref:type VI secretion system baseplate subunit TssK n=1 Tax=Aquisalimonas lutea TaxID=1327750 RepID=UPI0025B5A793|nr:type VI secretion system baseplate subunit TssK [Aquisalimonas lutea]MDN3519586.1 type VI secretion system baseplate subunit TssK [Aquisalimonas lutea]
MIDKKIAWLEGQYLFPQHFQQQERYLESRMEARAGAIRPYVWGVYELSIDQGALAEGKLALTRASGLMSDGTPFDLPGSAPLPAPLDVPAGTKELSAFLAVSRYQPGARFVDTGQEGRQPDTVARYHLSIDEVFDYSGEGGKAEPVETATLNASLALESSDLGGYCVLPVARIREVTQEGAVVLESRFIPPSLDVAQQRDLKGYLGDALGMLQQRGEALAARFNESGRSGGGSSAIADFLLLQLINRYETRLRHYQSVRQLHPEQLYTELAGLTGELATFTTRTKRPPDLVPYQHEGLYACFRGLMDSLEQELSTVLEQTAIALTVEERDYGIRVARLSDRSLAREAHFVLAARADAPTETVREKLPTLIKVGTVDTIRDLVNNQLPGIPVNALPVAPREIPYHAGSVYFELDGSSPHWEELKQSAGFAIHVAEDIPDLKLELWAIRQ